MTIKVVCAIISNGAFIKPRSVFSFSDCDEAAKTLKEEVDSLPIGQWLEVTPADPSDELPCNLKKILY